MFNRNKEKPSKSVDTIDTLVGAGSILKGDFEFTILGTSCERTPEEEMATNETESMEKKNARENPAMAAAMAMA